MLLKIEICLIILVGAFVLLYLRGLQYFYSGLENKVTIV